MFYSYQTTPRWRESPAMAHRRAERRRITEIRKRAAAYCDVQLTKERERFRQEREQMERWKALRLQKRREEWREKMVVREKVESQERAERAKLESQNLQVHAEKSKVKQQAKQEWLLCLKEELHKFDVADLPHLMALKNSKYDTHEDEEWYSTAN
jgi:hypothetical protein